MRFPGAGASSLKSVMLVALICGAAPPAIAGGPEPTEMISVPGGTFWMGDVFGRDNPAHRVRIDTFELDVHEVTNAQYAQFCAETGHRLPAFWGETFTHCGPAHPDHPVVGVSSRDAQAYAEWCGKRLPTEAEWEYAARGGLKDEPYSFGGQIDTTRARYSFEGRKQGTLPVASFAPNGYGLYDMTGNVVEWVADYYEADYYRSSPRENPLGPPKGKFRVIRGGGWYSGPFCNRVDFRNALPANFVDINVGFRCARDR